MFPYERLALAVALGALVGLERQVRRHPAGVQTHALVSLGSAAFTVVGAEAFGESDDPSRIAAQVVSGIGFLGAGTILRNGGTVRGLTTAATLWLSASIGVAAGAGALAVATAVAVLGLVVVVLMRAAVALSVARHNHVLAIDYRPGAGTLGATLRWLEQRGCRVDSLFVDEDQADRRRVDILFGSPDDGAVQGLVRWLADRPDVLNVEHRQGRQ